MTRRGHISYSAAEMRWLEANRTMIISDYHRAFCVAFKRTDITAANLHGLRKRKGWKVGRAKGRFTGRHVKFSKIEIAWLRDNCTLQIGDYHKAFCAAFQRTDITACGLHGLRKRMKWKTGRSGKFAKGAVPWSKGKKIGNNPGSARTQFKKGSRSGVALDLYKPIGFERIRDGYRVRKINDGFPLQARWRAVHILNFEKVNGPLPKDHCLKCLDGNTLNTDLSNWELVPRGMLPRLNNQWGRNYDEAPAELKPTIMAVAKLEHRVREKSTAPKKARAA
jgi:hypothetical protein